MSVERYIHGKHDSGKHEGKRSEIQRLAETDEEIIDFWRGVWHELWEAVERGEYYGDGDILDEA